MNKIKGIGSKYLITTDQWFMAPDGKMYSAVFGTVHGIETDELLGIKTNRNSTNWYIRIGNMIVAGCQVHYAVQTNECSFDPFVKEVEHEGGINAQQETSSRIYNADQ